MQAPIVLKLATMLPLLFALASLPVELAVAQQDPSQIYADDGPDFQPGDTVSNVYSMIAETKSNGDDCQAILDSLNAPKTLGETDDLRTLVGTRFNYVWQHSTDGKEWSSPDTAGDVDSSYHIDRLVIDINGDGQLDTLLRTPNAIQSQPYTNLYVEVPGDTDAFDLAAHTEISIKDVRPQEPLQIYPRALSGDFYAIDILHVQARNYIIAGDAINPHGEVRKPSVFVFTVGPSLNLNVVCYIKATKRF